MPTRRRRSPEEQLAEAVDDLFVDVRQVLARNIASRRRSAGYSQERLAELAGVSQVYLAQLEQARDTVNPTVRALSAIAHGLGCDVADLFVRAPVDAPAGARVAPRPRRLTAVRRRKT